MKLSELFESTLTVFRGTKAPEKTIGDSAKMKAIFATSSREYTKTYGPIAAAYAGKDVKILDYDVGERDTVAEKLVRELLISSGKMTAEKFDKDPRMAMALQFMIPTDEFIQAVKEAGYDAVHMHASNTDKDEFIIVSPDKFKRIEE